MSAFEVCITPTRNKIVKKNVKSNAESREPTLVSFGPFSGKSTVTFENVPITKTARRILIVRNPTDTEIKVLVTRGLRPEYNVSVEWTSQIVPPHGQVPMEMFWTPLKEFSCKETFQLTDSRNFKKDVTIIFKSTKNNTTTAARSKLTSKSQLNAASHGRPIATLKMKSPTGIRSHSNGKRKSIKKVGKLEDDCSTNVMCDKNSSALFDKDQITSSNKSSHTSVITSKKGKENISPLSPAYNASTLFDKIQFTPIAGKHLNDLDYLASLPTPGSRVRCESNLNQPYPSIIVENVDDMNVLAEKRSQDLDNTPRVQKDTGIVVRRYADNSKNRHLIGNSTSGFGHSIVSARAKKLNLEDTDYQSKNHLLNLNLKDGIPESQTHMINKTFDVNYTKGDPLLDISHSPQLEQHQQVAMNCTTVISGNAPRPLSIIEEEDRELCSSYNTSNMGKTFNLQQSEPQVKEITKQKQIRESMSVGISLRKFSESMKDLSDKPQQQHQTRRSLISNQGSMPNLNDMENLNSITENRYYDKETLFNANNHCNEELNISTSSMMSVTSATDVVFNQHEILAASSRFNINDLGVNSIKRSPIFLKTRCKTQSSPMHNNQKSPITPLLKPKRISLTPTEKCRIHNSTPDLASVENKKRLRKSLNDLSCAEQESLSVTQPLCIVISPPKRTKFDSELLKSENTTDQFRNDSQWSISYSSKKRNLQKTSTLSLVKRTATPRKVICIKQEPRNALYNPEMFLQTCINPDPFSATTTSDPFMTATMYLDKRSVAKHEIQIKKWLNALVSIPAEFDSDFNQKIDVAHLFNEVRNKQLQLPPTKEQQSINYLTTSRMEALRAASMKLFQSPELTEPCCKVTVQISKQLIKIRKDRDLHLDIVMQKEILQLLLNFNPLWLRIGLEVVFAERISLHSNTDIVGLSSFIVHRLFRDKYLEQKYSKAYTLSEEYSDIIKKFTLQKILFLLLFLDKAKEKRIIKHNPCLFIKNSPYKETKEILLRFSSELLASVGDITRTLRRFGYILTHKQTFLDEFDYAFNNLAVDLRDGVRLTRIMEIILMRDDLSKQLRVPAISRLQRIYNVNLALNALADADFKLTGNITSADIVDGHREKTLSLLWQIIYKFRAPKFNAAASIIQNWWRKSWLKVVIHRRIRQKEEIKKNSAATQIQSLFRGYLTRKYVKLYREKRVKATICLQKYCRRYLAHKKFNQTYRSILIIQRWYRQSKITKGIRMNYLKLRYSIIKIQIWYRRMILTRKLELAAPIIREIKNNARLQYRSANIIKKSIKSYLIHKRIQSIVYEVIKSDREMKVEYKSALKIQATFKMIICRKQFVMKKRATIKIQNYWRAYVIMKQIKLEYDIKKRASIVIQRYFKDYMQMKKERLRYLKIRSSVIVLQTRYRAMKIKNQERNNYQLIRKSIIKIQKFYRSVKETRRTREQYLQMKSNVIKVQQRFRANKEMHRQLEIFNKLKDAVIIVQRKYRANLLMRKQRLEYLRLRESTIKIQRKVHATLLAKQIREELVTLRRHTVNIQRRFRANCLMRFQRKEYLELKRSTIRIQEIFRANLKMKFERSKYLKLKQSTIVIQTRYRAYKEMRINRAKYQGTRHATIYIQKRFREYLLMKQEHNQFLTYRKAAITLQCRFRAQKSMLLAKEEFKQMKNAAHIIQSKFRASVAMKQQKSKYLRLRVACVKIQTWYRACKLRNMQCAEYLKVRRAVLIIQTRFRAQREMKIVRDEYQKLMHSTILIQRRFRSKRCMEREKTEYQRIKNAAILIQRKLRATILRNNQCSEYLKIRKSVIKIQRRFKATCEMKKIKCEYENYRKQIICIQTKYKAKKLMEKQRNEYLAIKKAAIVIQNHFRAKLMMKRERIKFLELKYYTIIVQRQFRSNLEMHKRRNEYLRTKELIIFVQRLYRAKLQMREERLNFLKLKSAVIYVQQKYRSRISARIEAEKYKSIKKAVNGLQAFARGYLARKHFNEMMTPEMREQIKKRKAVVTIQRYYRGYLVRKRLENYKIKVIRSRIRDLKKNVKPRNAVKYQLRAWIKCIRGRFNVQEVLNVLTKLENISRMLPYLLMEHSEQVSQYCYGMMAQAIRSEIDKHIIELCSRIILNMARYDCTTVNTFQESGLITIAQMLLRWCDKECGIFNTLCTLIWIFSHYPDKRRKIRAFMTTPEALFMLRETKKLVLRKEKMKKNVRKMSVSSTPQKQLAHIQNFSPQTLPNFEPDYGVIRNKPYIFASSVFAFETILNALHIDLTS